ncbi:MAG TPA: lysozyme inhibitor LprI family protein [Gaiellaceae bacterium]|nr:lysozyme inhibitor LprI family protein [Gaiellaceae bacterium]
MRSILVTLLAAASVTPPVIHEPFHALPCPLHPDTTIDVEGCQEHRVLRTDRQIDAQVKAIFRLLRAESIRATFVTGERSWLHYRRQSCAAEASHFAGGTMHGVAFLSCSLQRNKTHLVDLSAMRKTLAQR